MAATNGFKVMSAPISAFLAVSPGAGFSLVNEQGWADQVLADSATVPFKDLGMVIVWSESSILSSEYGLDYLA